MPGLCFGYFTYERSLPPQVSSAFHPLPGDWIHGPLGQIIHIVAVVSTVFGLTVSIGLGALQINSGMNYVFGVPVAGWVQAALLVVITAAALTSVLAGMDRGVKNLSYLNILLAFALLVFVLMTSASSSDIARGTVESTGWYLSHLPMLTTFNDTMHYGKWSGELDRLLLDVDRDVGSVRRPVRGEDLQGPHDPGVRCGIPRPPVDLRRDLGGHLPTHRDRRGPSQRFGPQHGGALARTIVDDGNPQAALFQFLRDLP